MHGDDDDDVDDVDDVDDDDDDFDDDVRQRIFFQAATNLVASSLAAPPSGLVCSVAPRFTILVSVADAERRGFHPVAFGLRVLLLAQEVAVPILVEPPALVLGHFVPSFWRERVL